MYDGTDEDAEKRVVEVRRIVEDESFAAGERIDEAEPRLGYRVWSERYDEPGNPIIAIEEPVVRSLIDATPPGRALDAGCGTGRHSRYLVDRGHDVLGIDLTPEMLAYASANVRGAIFREGDLCAIPSPDASFDLVVSGLAIAHVADLDRAVAEMARVLRPSGRVILSVLHPFQALLGWHAPFEDETGQRRFVREHAHTHADYLRAFRAAGLTVIDCVEPKLGADEVRQKRRAFRHVAEATVAAYVGLPGVLVLAAIKG
ncbi:MAG: class I SAM-dependent methyltransferase [Kofleriaceae bacterium]|nr:class I SAM-dependent methyltransferase [Kofleriaceae bacterium]